MILVGKKGWDVGKRFPVLVQIKWEAGGPDCTLFLVKDPRSRGAGKIRNGQGILYCAPRFDPEAWDEGPEYVSRDGYAWISSAKLGIEYDLIIHLDNEGALTRLRSMDDLYSLD